MRGGAKTTEITLANSLENCILIYLHTYYRGATFRIVETYGPGRTTYGLEVYVQLSISSSTTSIQLVLGRPLFLLPKVTSQDICSASAPLEQFPSIHDPDALILGFTVQVSQLSVRIAFKMLLKMNCLFLGVIISFYRIGCRGLVAFSAVSALLLTSMHVDPRHLEEGDTPVTSSFPTLILPMMLRFEHKS